MSVAFAVHFKEMFKAAPEAQVLDKGMFLQGTNGDAVILVHGMTGTPNEMMFLANFLHKKGYTVHCPRLANHGSPIWVLKYTKWQDLYRTVRESFLELSQQHARVYVSGLSMGGLLGLLLAEEFKGKVAGVSCLSPTLFYDGWNTPWYRCLLPIAYYTPLKYWLFFKESPPYGIKNEAIQRRVDDYYKKANLKDMSGVEQFGYPFFPVSLLYQLEKLRDHLVARLNKIATPLQLIQAENDDMTSVRNSQFIFDRVGSSQKEIVLLHNSYHVITADQERAKVADNVAAFFAKAGVTKE